MCSAWRRCAAVEGRVAVTCCGRCEPIKWPSTSRRSTSSTSRPPPSTRWPVPSRSTSSSCSSPLRNYLQCFQIGSFDRPCRCHWCLGLIFNCFDLKKSKYWQNLILIPNFYNFFTLKLEIFDLNNQKSKYWPNLTFETKICDTFWP